MHGIHRAVRAFTALGLTAFLAACGGGSPDPMQAFTRQVLAWEQCDPTIIDDAYASAFGKLGERLRCANMRAPLDHADSSKGEITVALMRVSARKPAERRGAIFFNPGGPGGDGLYLAPYFGMLWSGSDAMPARELVDQLADRYDLVGFSPRGVGASTNLYCRSNERMRPVMDGLDRSDANIQNILHNAKLKAYACLKNPLTRYINTDQTARDMDLARELMGDKKFNYIGYSYGTWLGAWYANLFPERVGRMLLDSSMNVGGTLEDDTELLQEMASQRVLDQILVPYGARNHASFNLGATETEIQQILPGLPPALRSVTSEAIFNSLYSHKPDESLLRLTAAKGIHALMKNKAYTNEYALKTDIEGYAFSATPKMNVGAVNFARELAKAYFERLDEFNNPPSVELSPHKAGASVFVAVICNDTPFVRSEQFWVEQGNRNAQLYSLAGGNLTDQPCLYWGGPSTVKPPLDGARRVPGILIVQSEFDMATPLPGAMKTLEALPNARMILVNGEYQHALFPYQTACVDEPVARYFLDGTLPAERVSQCKGKSPVVPQIMTKGSGKTVEVFGPAVSPASAYVERIHEIVREANRPRR